MSGGAGTLVTADVLKGRVPDGMPMARILIVEDERQIAELLSLYIVRAGFEAVIAAGMSAAIREHGSRGADLVLLDLGLPDGDGLSVLEAIRRAADTPVIIATALDDEETRVAALRAGADDYVLKPFRWAELVERVRAVLRRTHGLASRRTLKAGPLIVDLDGATATLLSPEQGGDATTLRLTRSEFDLVACLARHPRRAFTRDNLMEATMAGRDVFDRVVDSHLSKARAKFASAGWPNLIQPVRGVGYRLWPSE